MRIVDHLKHDLDSPAAARRFGDELASAIDRICVFPRLYAVSRLPRLAHRGYRVCFFDGYALVYRHDTTDEGEGSVIIVRIVPASSDYGHIV